MGWVEAEVEAGRGVEVGGAPRTSCEQLATDTAAAADADDVVAANPPAPGVTTRPPPATVARAKRRSMVSYSRGRAV